MIATDVLRMADFNTTYMTTTYIITTYIITTSYRYYSYLECHSSHYLPQKSLHRMGRGGRHWVKTNLHTQHRSPSSGHTIYLAFGSMPQVIFLLISTESPFRLGFDSHEIAREGLPLTQTRTNVPAAKDLGCLG